MKFVNNQNAIIDFAMEVPYLSFPVLSDIPFIKHGFSTRLGGVSKDMFATMNLGTDSGDFYDDPNNVMENYKRIANSIGVDPNTIVISKQVHKTKIRLVDDRDLGKGLFRERDYDEIDGLITNKPNITLVTKYADCVPLYLVDTKRKAIGLSHSGWRGTVKKIGLLTVNEMQKHFGSNPEDIIAVIGPSICQDCYEIGEEVAKEFQTAFSLSDNNPILLNKGEGKYQCNLWEANRIVFKEAGLKTENIHLSKVCTCCNSDLLFSHRKTGVRRGSLAAFLSIV